MHLEDESPLPPGKHFHCPKLAWPIVDTSQATNRYVCDWCLRNGILYYHRTVAIQQETEFNKRHHELLYSTGAERPAGPSRGLVPDISEDEDEDEDEEDGGDDEEASESTESVHEEGGAVLPIAKESMPSELYETRLFPRASEIEGRFPPNWSSLHVHFKRFIRDKYCRDEERTRPTPPISFEKDQSFENHWQPRLDDEPYRVLTLWIPCCTICKKPSFNYRGGVKDVEFEPSAIFWKWLRRLQGEPFIATKIATGFIYKPCDKCINREIELRLKVGEYLNTCGNMEAWAVWNWLMMRGTGGVQFWNHESTNAGLPGEEARPRESFMRLMTSGWKAKSGIAWEDTVDLNPPVSCPVTSSRHDEPLLNLEQWYALAGVPDHPDPVIRSPDPAAYANMRPFDEENQLADGAAVPEQETSADKIPIVTIPDSPTEPVVEDSDMVKWNMKRNPFSMISISAKGYRFGQPRFLTFRQAMIDEHSRAVRVLLDKARIQRAVDKAGRLFQERLNQRASSQVPIGQTAAAVGNYTGSAKQPAKRKASADIPGPEAKRPRVANGSVGSYPSPSAAESRRASPDIIHPGDQDAGPSESSGDLGRKGGGRPFGDKQNNLTPEGDSSPNGDAGLVESRWDEDVEDDPSIGTFTQCTSGFWHLHGRLTRKDTWRLPLGVEEKAILDHD